MTDERTAPAQHELPEPVRQAARSAEPDRYLAALLAPRARRSSLIALAAFAAEIRRIPMLVSEPAIGEIRLAWWREELTRSPPGRSTGHPVADALQEARERHDLPTEPCLGLIEARASELYSDPPHDDADLAGFFATTETALFVMAGQIIDRAATARHLALFEDAGQAYGCARMLAGLTRLHRRGRTMLPTRRLAAAGLTRAQLSAGGPPPGLGSIMQHYRDEAWTNLARLRPGLRTLLRPLRSALLPLALVEPYLQASERVDDSGHPLGSQDITPLRRIWRIWRAHAFGRF